MKQVCSFFEKSLAAVLLIAALLIPATKVSAASAVIEFSKDAENVRVGDVVIVTLSITAEVVPGEFEGYLSYSDKYLEYVTGPNCIAGGEGILKINDTDPETDLSVRKYTLYFKASKIGSCEIAMRGVPEIYEAESGYLMSVSSGSLTFDVMADVKASSDASLAGIKVSPGTLEPKFSPDVYEYNVSVRNAVTSLMVSANANDLASTVKIEGNSNLAVGQNRVLIRVTAEDGTVAKYVIYVARADEEAPTGEPEPDGEQNETPDNPAGSENTDKSQETYYFYATDADGDAVLNVGSRYTVCTDTAKITVPDGYTKTSILISGHTVTAYTPVANPDSDYLLLILSKDGGNPGLYSFDRIERTIQRYNGEGATDSLAGSSGNGSGAADEAELRAGYEKSLSKMTIIIAVLCGAVMLLLILLISTLVRRGRRNDDDGYSGSSRSTGSTRSSGSTRSAGSTRSSGSMRSTGSARSSGSTRSTGSTRNSGSTRSSDSRTRR